MYSRYQFRHVHQAPALTSLDLGMVRPPRLWPWCLSLGILAIYDQNIQRPSACFTSLWGWRLVAFQSTTKTACPVRANVPGGSGSGSASEFCCEFLSRPTKVIALLLCTLLLHSMCIEEPTDHSHTCLSLQPSPSRVHPPLSAMGVASWNPGQPSRARARTRGYSHLGTGPSTICRYYAITENFWNNA